VGRTSKLSQDAWAQIERRLAGGAGVRMLAREFAIDPAAISRRFPQQSQHLRELARKLADIQNDVAALPVQQQHLVAQLAAELRQITGDLTGAARAGAATARRLTEQAHRQAIKIDGSAPLTEKSVAAVDSVSALTRCANEAASIGLKVLEVFGETAREAEEAAKGSHTKVRRVEIVPMTASASYS
jgi:hypothetical protein